MGMKYRRPTAPLMGRNTSRTNSQIGGHPPPFRLRVSCLLIFTTLRSTPQECYAKCAAHRREWPLIYSAVLFTARPPPPYRGRLTFKRANGL